MKEKDTVILLNKPDPYKAFQALARIIGEKEGVEITLKGLRRKDGVDENIENVESAESKGTG